MMHQMHLRNAVPARKNEKRKIKWNDEMQDTSAAVVSPTQGRCTRKKTHLLIVAKKIRETK